MVDPFQLATDIVQADAFLLLPALLWLGLFLFAWERPTLARRAGFGRTTFWLLLPGAVLGQLSDLPFFGWEGAILAVNVGGGLIPVLLSFLLFRDAVGDVDRATAVLLATLVAEAGAMFVTVVVFPSGLVGLLLVLLIGTATPLVLASFSLGPASKFVITLRRTAVFIALCSGVMVATYASTSTVPSEGIVSAFPYYLLGPVSAGILAVLLAPRAFGLSRLQGLGLSYSASTLGVLFGADLLRQPPLYGNGAALYSIGGAGVFDLVYLSGLLALLAGLATLYVVGVGPDRPTPLASPEPSPAARLRRALQHGLAGRPKECIDGARSATHASAEQTRLLWGLPSASGAAPPWQGLPVASWVTADQRNLDTLADRGAEAPKDAFRAWLTARWLVGIGRELSRERFASLGTRSFAFLLDTVLLLVPAGLSWLFVSKYLHGSVDHILSTPLFNAVALALPAYGFLYFVILESGYGTTVGKHLFGLRVTDRSLRGAPVVNVLVRNVPKLVPLTVLGIGGSLVVLALVRGATGVIGGGSGLDAYADIVIAITFVLVGVGVGGVVSALTIHASSESQRLGDFFAGTWVVRDVFSPGASVEGSTQGGAGSVPSG